MVNNATAITKNGLQDWLLQRITAVLIAAYAIYLLVFFLQSPEPNYVIWTEFTDKTTFKVATLVTYFAIAIHAWLGLWIVCTDYIKNKLLRVSALVTIFLCLGISVGWLIRILWG